MDLDALAPRNSAWRGMPHASAPAQPDASPATSSPSAPCVEALLDRPRGTTATLGIAPPATAATRKDLCDIVLALEHTGLDCTVAQLQQALRERRLWADRDEIRVCALLESPLPSIIGLGRFRRLLQSAWQQQADLFDDAQKLAAATIGSSCQGEARLKPLRAFVMLHLDFLLSYLALRLRGFAPRPEVIAAVRRQCQLARLATVRDMVVAYEEGLTDFVVAWSQRGLAAHVDDLRGFLAWRHIRASPIQMPSLCALLPRVTRLGHYLFPVDQAPVVTHFVVRKQEVKAAFRGQAPSLLDGAEPPAATPAQAGLCATLLRDHPRGCSKRQLCDLLAQILPQFNRKQIDACLRSMLYNAQCVPIGDGRYMVNPDLLCRGRREALLARLPDRRGWPPPWRDLSRPRAKKPRYFSAYARQQIVKARRGSFGTTTVGVERTAAIFETLSALSASGALARYIVPDEAGEPSFHTGRIAEQVQHRRTDVTGSHVWEALKCIDPLAIEHTLRQRQWEKTRLPPPLITGALRSLCEELPFAYCMPLNTIAALINQRQPDFFLDALSLRAQFRRLPVDMQAIADIVDALFADGRISPLRQRRGGLIKLSRLNTYLALHELHCGSEELEDLVEAQLRSMPPDTQAYIDADLASNPLHRHAAARAVLAHRLLATQMQMPSWQTFIQAFHELFCQPPAPSGPLLCYSGADATEIYFTVQRLHAARRPAIEMQATDE
ncbi:hypothetical protein GT347_10075 [Xylophilus rhododendri]|uniref:Uncharacterized protein n=1 Tax=Xylophilus rhododendri TaxID=2697032 RepID=A0A857J2Z8_9BURK|nr:hypothetical protein [Xylophilus rhododendri]QHI98310.1 hypothetical protein GT347_10075 [Xylophilus rhododendri]